MKTNVTLPAAFSVRDANEFFPMQHVMARMNSNITITQIATGRHINGGNAVLWGLVHKEGQPLTKKEVEDALREAGFDFANDATIHATKLWAVELEEATQCRAAGESGSAVIGGRYPKRKTVEQAGQSVSSKS